MNWYSFTTLYITAFEDFQADLIPNYSGDQTNRNRTKREPPELYYIVTLKYAVVLTVAINELLCMKNAGAQIAMDFS